MQTDDVEDDIEELHAARARMMRNDAVWFHRIVQSLDDDQPARPARLLNDLGLEQ